MEVELCGSVAVSTNNRMELLAVIMALKSLDAGSNVYLFTDSQYVQKGIQFWVPAWKRKGWMNSQKKPVVNRDLWEMLDAENGRHMVSWHWVRGHDGDKYNERCDVLARTAAHQCNQLQQEGSPS
jgi:ribonuclease HI